MTTGAPVLFDACEQGLSGLLRKHGFGAAERECIGREYYVRFHRGHQTVSIAWEPGSSPILELFYPPISPQEYAVPWAERNGVARARRIPQLRTSSTYDPNDLTRAAAYFAEVGSRFAKEESQWLAT
jgi:hypothetical protein